MTAPVMNEDKYEALMDSAERRIKSTERKPCTSATSSTLNPRRTGIDQGP
jgi:hypothetical protein